MTCNFLDSSQRSTTPAKYRPSPGHQTRSLPPTSSRGFRPSALSEVGRTSVKSSASSPPPSARTTAPSCISPSSGSELCAFRAAPLVPRDSRRPRAAPLPAPRSCLSDDSTRSATSSHTALAPATATCSELDQTTTSFAAAPPASLLNRILAPVSACSFLIVAPDLPMTPPMCPRVSTWHSHHLGPHFSHRPRSSTFPGPACKPLILPPLLLLLLLLLFALLFVSFAAASMVALLPEMRRERRGPWELSGVVGSTPTVAGSAGGNP
mmetsp:Transcript_4946/g.22638  ORF Transcript_4946/g.22638 Transcript_4946/m.22638 type:complete len:266 (+) Transcript_4946:1513-2310(+)